MQQLLKLYLKRLTNLTGNNRSILLRRLIAEQFLDMNELSFVQDKQTSFQIIEQLIARKPEIKIAPLADSRDSAANIVSKKLRKLQRISRFIYDERGSQDLYVGWPFIRGKLSDGTLIRCPLLFFPVDIMEDGKHWKLVLRQDVNITLNKSFLLAYAYFNDVKLPEKLYDKSFNEWEADSRIFRTKLYKLFREEPLEINFNQEIFIDQLISFQNYTAAELKEQTKEGELKLYPEAVIGIFPQAGSFIVPDYNYLLSEDKLKSMEDLFISRFQRRDSSLELPAPATDAAGLHEELSRIREETIFAPFPMDYSQEAAIRAIKAGRSLVVQGPPGTGKSQLIANVMADAMAKGKRVLLVSQKKAALDVVHKRLDQKMIVDFVALVHDFKWDRKKIYEQIARQIDRVPEYKTSNSGLDTIQPERRFLQASRRIEQIKEELREFKHALFDDSECGISVKDLYLDSERKGPAVDLRQEYKFYPLTDIEPFLRKLRSYLRLASRIQLPNYPWQDRLSFAGFGVADQQKIADVIGEIYPFQERLSQKLNDLLQNNLTFESAEYLLSRKESIEEMLDLVKEPEVYRFFQHMTGFKPGAADPHWLLEMERSLLQCYEGEGPELSLKAENLGVFQEILQNRMEAKRNAVKWISWRYFSKEDSSVRRVMVKNKLKDTTRDMELLEQKVDSRLNLEHNLTRLKENEWLLDVPETYAKPDFQQWFLLQKKALAALEIFYQIRGLSHYYNVKKLTYQQLKEKLEQFFEIVSEIPKAKERWYGYLTTGQVEQLLQVESYARQLTDTLEDDFDSISEFDRMKEKLSKEEFDLLQKLISVTGFSGEEEVVKLFLNSLKLAWINHIEAKYPVLRAVTTMSLQQLEEELRSCVEEKAAISQEMLLMKVREQTYQQLEYNRLNNLVTYRDLRHQVEKKRKIWPIRKMVSAFSDELFQLVPCWMASPEAVSAIFPMEEIFDLVIFDEASQCFVEKGIPAMYRGKQIVVTGDSKQLQPNDLYQVRWEQDEADEELAEMEVDSLLSLAGRHLMQIELKGHYRSRAPELIDFSNRQFYGGRLQVIPELEVTNRSTPAIRYRKVEGIWEDQANPLEAEKVVELVFEICKEEKEKELQSGKGNLPWYEARSVGVVTFNAKQQGLIQDMLDERAGKESIMLPDNLFVKNIENVQGDERDIIIFSIGYAPDKKGNMSMQFGSLNAMQGENRLNVAITRARDQIYVVSSIMPWQLTTDESKNEGPRLFKAYLQYALDVSEGKYQPQPYQPKQHRFTAYLKERLKNFTSGSEYSLEERQPFADLTVFKEGQNSGLIFTDDARYFSMRSVKEVHVYRKQELEEKKWRSLFVFSREYWHDPVKLKEKLNRFVHHL